MKKKIYYICDRCNCKTTMTISVELPSGSIFNCPNCLAELIEHLAQENEQLTQALYEEKNQHLDDTLTVSQNFNDEILELTAIQDSLEKRFDSAKNQVCGNCKYLFDKEGGELSESNG